DLIDAMALSADDTVTDAQLAEVEENACPTCGSCSGMFTANSMNCLAEVLGLSLPGNGTTLATHAFRKELFLEAGHKIVELAKRYYEEEDESVLPRSIATKAAFSNAMAMDVAMGGSTNTILHILAVAIEAGVDFGLDDIDRISRVVPTLSKVAPNGTAHVEDVHRAGGIPAILGELDRGGLLDQPCHSRPGARGPAPPSCSLPSPVSPGWCRPCPRSLPTGPRTWRTSPVPVGSRRSSGSSPGPACWITPSTPCIPRTWPAGWPNGTSAAGRRRRRRWPCSAPRPAGCAPPRRSPPPTPGMSWTPTVRREWCGRSRTHTPRTVAWRSSRAISPRTAPCSRQRA